MEKLEKEISDAGRRVGKKTAKDEEGG